MITYERQNKWMTDYVLPIFLGQFGDIAENYRQNKAAERKAISDAMRTPEVLASLQKLEQIGPGCDKPLKEFAQAIDRRYIDTLKFDKISMLGGELGGPGIEHFFSNYSMPFNEGTRKLGENSRYVGFILDEKTLKLIREASAVKEDPNPRGFAGAA